MKDTVIIATKTAEAICSHLAESKAGLAALLMGQDLANLNREEPVRTENDILQLHQKEKLEKKHGKALEN